MRYQVGDKVRVRSWEEMEDDFGLDGDGDIDMVLSFVGFMREYCGKILTISNIINNCYVMLNNGWSWTDDMLENVTTYKIGDIVRIREWDDLVATYGLHPYFVGTTDLSIINTPRAFTTLKMRQYCGTIATVSYVDFEGDVYIKEDGSAHCWPVETLLLA